MKIPNNQIKMENRSKQVNINRKISNGQEAFKNCLTPFAIKEIQIKMILKYYVMSVIMTKNKNTDDSLY